MSSKLRYARRMIEPRWLTAAEELAWRRYRRMRTLLDLQLARDLARDAGLSESDYDVLSTLTEAEGHRWRAGDLAVRLLWSSSRLSHHVGRMERRGLVARAPIGSDKRGALITLTTKGLETIGEAAPGHVGSVRRNFIDLLTPEEVDVLATIAHKVIGHLGASAPPRVAP